MAKKTTGRVPAVSQPLKNPSTKEDPLSYREERFVEAYVSNGNNATQAAIAAGYGHAGSRVAGYRLLTRANVLEAVEAEKERLRQVSRFSREQAIDILIGMATATLADFADVFSDPADQKNYLNLGNKRHAIESGKKTVTSLPKGGEIETSEIRIISPGERRAVIDDLWTKLGFDKDGGGRDRKASIGELLGLVRSKASRGGSGG